MFFKSIDKQMRLTLKSVTNSDTFAAYVKKSFEEVDFDNTKKLDHKELHIALLLLYDKLNSLLPVHMPVPTREEVASYITRFDSNNSGGLEYAEFLELAKTLFGGHKNWKDSIILRAGSLIVMNLLIWPLAGSGVRRGAVNLGIAGASAIPIPVWVILVESLTKTAKSTFFK